MTKKGEPDRITQLNPHHVDRNLVKALAGRAQRALETQGIVPGLPNGSPPIYDGPQAGGVVFDMPTGQQLTQFTSEATGQTAHISVSPTRKGSQVTITDASGQRILSGQDARQEAANQIGDVERAVRQSRR